MSTSQGPHARFEYERRLDQRRKAARHQERLEVRIAVLRFGVFLTAPIMAWLSFRDALFSAWWLLLPFGGFLALIILHERLRKARRRLERAADFYERGIARIENRWAGAGASGDRFLDKTHAYAEDLDLFGRGSLFELICAARTRSGEETLARWLTNPAGPDAIRERQTAVRELSERLDLREGLAVLGTDIGPGVKPDALAAWGNSPLLLDSLWPRVAAAVLSFAAVLALLLWTFRDTGRDAFLLLALLEGLFFLLLRGKIRRVLEAVETACQDLGLFSQILMRLQSESFSSSRLTQLRAALETDSLPASRKIAQLDRLVVMRRQLFAPLAALLLWDVQTAFAIEAWRKVSGPAVARWLEVVGEMEALCSLAGHAYEHPDDAFPEIKPEGACFDGESLGHPFLPEERCVRNDVRLCTELRVLIVSGSNMSGKSTLLRTVGVNAVLALAGAPVRARRLVISPLALGASLQRRDSLQAGTSRFYAEITRLRQLVDLTAGPAPLLFLLDELLHGTNSHDRSIGAEALISDLVRRGAIGLLTTHDLALSHIADSLAHQAENVHFEDFVENGKLVFDYRLRPGVVRNSNALKLMRSIGLQV